VPETPPPEDQHKASEWYIAKMIEDADGDDEHLLRLVADGMDVVKAHKKRLDEVQLQAAIRLRNEGVPMQRIARLARVSDSALSRRIIRAGGIRRVDRRRSRRKS
jgi:hypothetical protein